MVVLILFAAVLGTVLSAYALSVVGFDLIVVLAGGAFGGSLLAGLVAVLRVVCLTLQNRSGRRERELSTGDERSRVSPKEDVKSD